MQQHDVMILLSKVTMFLNWHFHLSKLCLELFPVFLSFALIFSVTLAKPLTVSGLKAGRWLGLASRLSYGSVGNLLYKAAAYSLIAPSTRRFLNTNVT